jgi:hypothetical protein
MPDRDALRTTGQIHFPIFTKDKIPQNCILFFSCNILFVILIFFKVWINTLFVAEDSGSAVSMTVSPQATFYTHLSPPTPLI